MKTDFLQKDENILWSGRPGKNFSFKSGIERMNFTRGIAEITVLAVVLGLYIHRDPEWNIPLTLLLAGIALLAAASPLLTHYRLLGQRYWITDKRAIVTARDGSIYSMEHHTVRDLELMDGDCVVMSNEPLSGSLSQVWRIAGHPQSTLSTEGQIRSDALAFYHVDRAGEALELLRKLTKSA